MLWDVYPRLTNTMTVFRQCGAQVCTAMALPLSIGLVMLLGWNLYLLLANKTTIEYHEVRAFHIDRVGAHADI